MMPDFGGAIFGAVMDSYGAVLNNQLAEQREERARRRNYYYGERAAANADARTRALMNDFQTPEAQLKLLREAGLSPSLMFGGQGAGGQSIPSGAQGAGAAGISPTTYGVSPVDAAQIGLITAETRKTNAEADTELGINERGQQELNQLRQAINNAWYDGEIKAADAMIKQIDLQIKGETGQTEIDIKRSELEELRENIAHIKFMNKIAQEQGKITEAQAKWAEQYYFNEILEQTADILYKNMQTKLTGMQTSYTKAEIANVLQNMGLNRMRYDFDVDKFEKQLTAQIEQWDKENKNKDQDQQIATAKMILEFIQNERANKSKEKSGDKQTAGNMLMNFLWLLVKIAPK